MWKVRQYVDDSACRVIVNGHADAEVRVDRVHDVVPVCGLVSNCWTVSPIGTNRAAEGMGPHRIQRFSALGTERPPNGGSNMACARAAVRVRGARHKIQEGTAKSGKGPLAF